MLPGRYRPITCPAGTCRRDAAERAARPRARSPNAAATARSPGKPPHRSPSKNTDTEPPAEAEKDASRLDRQRLTPRAEQVSQHRPRSRPHQHEPSRVERDQFAVASGAPISAPPRAVEVAGCRSLRRRARPGRPRTAPRGRLRDDPGAGGMDRRRGRWPEAESAPPARSDEPPPGAPLEARPPSSRTDARSSRKRPGEPAPPSRRDRPNRTGPRRAPPTGLGAGGYARLSETPPCSPPRASPRRLRLRSKS